MVTGGSECSGSNNPLAKLLPQISGAAAMRENQPAVQIRPSTDQGFRTHQSSAEPPVVDEFDHGPLMRMGDLSNEIEGLNFSKLDEMHYRPPNHPHDPAFADDFLRANYAPQPSGRHFHQEGGFRNQKSHDSPQRGLDWSQEFVKFSIPQKGGPVHPHSPGVGAQLPPRPFMPMMAPAPLVPHVHTLARKPSLDSAQWAAGFEQAMSLAKPKDGRVVDDMARTAGLLIDSVDVEGNEKFKASSFMKLMHGFRDGELKVEGDKIVAASEQPPASHLQLDKAAEPAAADPTALAKNWTEEFIESQEALQTETKATLGELSDGEFEQAFKFTNWVDEYKDQIRSMKDWERYDAAGRGYRAANPLYDNYQFAPNNPFINAPLPVVEAASNRQELSEALLALEAKVQRTPEDASAWHLLGVRQQQNERESAAIAALRQAVRLDSTLCDAWLALSVSYTNENCVPDAYDALESWVQNNPKYQHLLSGRAPSAENQRHDHIFELFLDAVRTNVDGAMDPEVQIGLGVLLNISEEYEKAVDCFQTALSTRPDDYLLWNKLGATLANSQQPTKAIEAYFRALELNPTFIRARYNLAISSINLGQYKEATEHLLAALSLQLQEREVALPAEMGGSQQLPHGATNAGSSSHVWDTLRMTLYMLDRADLVEKCDARDLEAFRDEFAF
ncbi:hypothetical protein L0F63_007136 [Massospora cicadina]|nr:hypothetical protein L0F63_007136 [Massospora cicadina]